VEDLSPLLDKGRRDDENPNIRCRAFAHALPNGLRNLQQTAPAQWIQADRADRSLAVIIAVSCDDGEQPSVECASGVEDPSGTAA
jgi:hypothetical protein